jgi:hypothetical protein
LWKEAGAARPYGKLKIIVENHAIQAIGRELRQIRPYQPAAQKVSRVEHHRDIVPQV